MPRTEKKLLVLCVIALIACGIFIVTTLPRFDGHAPEKTFYIVKVKTHFFGQDRFTIEYLIDGEKQDPLVLGSASEVNKVLAGFAEQGKVVYIDERNKP